MCLVLAASYGLDANSLINGAFHVVVAEAESLASMFRS
jgi:hypothetical protein